MEILKKEDLEGFSRYSSEYIEKGFSVIPEKKGKKSPCIKDWTLFSHRQATDAELASWKRLFPDAGLSIMLGKVSGVVALDVDECRPEVLAIIENFLPVSPCEKVGAKGYTRFFRFTGEANDNLKFNGEMVVEILSTGKKTHLPPSLHPSGVNYKWTGESELLDVDVNSLPILPPALLSHIGSLLRLHFPDLETKGQKAFSGRTDALSSLCGKLIHDCKPVDQALKELIEFDKKNHSPPKFSDPEECRHTEVYTNALAFYSDHLNSINTRRYRDKKEYEIPITASAVTQALGEEAKKGKLPSREELKNPRENASPVHTAKKMCPCCNKPRRK